MRYGKVVESAIAQRDDDAPFVQYKRLRSLVERTWHYGDDKKSDGPQHGVPKFLRWLRKKDSSAAFTSVTEGAYGAQIDGDSGSDVEDLDQDEPYETFFSILLGDIRMLEEWIGRRLAELQKQPRTRQVEAEAQDLVSLIDLNREAARKIVKKLDKRSRRKPAQQQRFMRQVDERALFSVMSPQLRELCPPSEEESAKTNDIPFAAAMWNATSKRNTPANTPTPTPTREETQITFGAAMWNATSQRKTPGNTPTPTPTREVAPVSFGAAMWNAVN